MARTDNLTNFLTDVADSIREKKGTSEPILASNFDTEIDSITTGGSEYEYAEFDPFNVFEILDNDTEPYESKMILLFINDGNNTVSISGNAFNGVTKIKSSDGQVIEKPSSGTFQIVFDDSKDALNEQGLKVRYLIAYAPERTTINLYDGNNLALSKRVLVYYFKNYDLNIGDRTFIYSGSITKLLKYDDDSNYYVRNKQIGYYGGSLLEFDLKTDNSGKSLEMSFYQGTALKKLRLNLQGITSLYYLCSGCGDLQEVEFYNCPEETIPQNSIFDYCNSFKKFKAYPYFLVNASDVFSKSGASSNIAEVSGVDFSLYSGGINNAKNLVKLERIRNINVFFDIQNCLLISYDSLLNIINALEDLSGQTAKNLILGTVNKAKLEQTEEGMQAIALAVSKNWTVS